MLAQPIKSILYLAGTLGSVIIYLALTGSRFEVLAVTSGLFSILFAAMAVYVLPKAQTLGTLAAVLILAPLFFVYAHLLSNDFEANAGIVPALQNSLLNSQIWLSLPPSVFAGLCLWSLATDRESTARVTSLSPDIAFGGALFFSFYSSLRFSTYATNADLLQSRFSSFLGNSIIHYIIIGLFFILSSYILRSILSINARSILLKMSRGQPVELLPAETSLRKFVRILIGTLPMLGFLGTVLGITQAMAGLPQLFESSTSLENDLIGGLSTSFSSIAIAFETTMLGLIASLIATVSLSYVEKLDSDLSRRALLETRYA